MGILLGDFFSGKEKVYSDYNELLKLSNLGKLFLQRLNFYKKKVDKEQYIIDVIVKFLKDENLPVPELKFNNTKILQKYNEEEKVLYLSRKVFSSEDILFELLYLVSMYKYSLLQESEDFFEVVLDSIFSRILSIENKNIEIIYSGYSRKRLSEVIGQIYGVSLNSLCEINDSFKEHRKGVLNSDIIHIYSPDKTHYHCIKY